MLDGVGISWPGGSPENTGLILALIVGAYFVVLWLSAVVWTARDIHQRTPEPMAQLVFTLIVLIFNFPGLVIYRVLRPPLTLQEAEEHRLESSALLRELDQTAALSSLRRRDRSRLPRLPALRPPASPLLRHLRARAGPRLANLPLVHKGHSTDAKRRCTAVNHFSGRRRTAQYHR